jgi:hypothetical protein
MQVTGGVVLTSAKTSMSMATLCRQPTSAGLLTPPVTLIMTPEESAGHGVI